MSTSASKLRLGPLPRHETVKLTISVPAALKDELDLYAAEFSQLHEPADAVVLIPHMLEAFMARDRAFNSAGGKRTLRQATPEHATAGSR